MGGFLLDSKVILTATRAIATVKIMVICSTALDLKDLVLLVVNTKSKPPVHTQ